MKPSDLFTHLAPVLNVGHLAAERAFYESLGLPVTYEGGEYPDFVAFTTDSINFGIQQAPASNDPPSVLTWQLAVSDVDAAAEGQDWSSPWSRRIRLPAGGIAD